MYLIFYTFTCPWANLMGPANVFNILYFHLPMGKFNGPCPIFYQPGQGPFGLAWIMENWCHLAYHMDHGKRPSWNETWSQKFVLQSGKFALPFKEQWNVREKLWKVELFVMQYHDGCCGYHGWFGAGNASLRECFKDAYELLNQRAFKFSPANKMYIFQCMGKIFLCGISKDTFEIPHKISDPYIERCKFYTTSKF